MKKWLNALKSVAFVTFKEWGAYRSHMILSLIIGPLFFTVQYFIWNAILRSGGEINGQSLQDMIAYYGLVILLHYLIMDFADWNLQMLIRTGKFITFLLRPLPHWFFAFSQKVGHRSLGFFLEFLPVYLCLTLVFKTRLIPEKAGWFLLSVSFSFLILFFINYSIGITGFWLTRTEGISLMFSVMRDFMAGVYIPLVFLPGALQKLFFLLPFQYITYVPIRVFLGSYELGGITLSIEKVVALQGIMVIVMFGVSRLLWKLGIKRFTGVGA